MISVNICTHILSIIDIGLEEHFHKTAINWCALGFRASSGNKCMANRALHHLYVFQRTWEPICNCQNLWCIEICKIVCRVPRKKNKYKFSLMMSRKYLLHTRIWLLVDDHLILKGGGGWYFLEINILTLKMLKINNMFSIRMEINNPTLPLLEMGENCQFLQEISARCACNS